MDNVLETNGVPLTVFGGAVPELAPEDLPEGACPFNQDVDFNPGSVFTRGGRSNVYTFLNQVFTATPNLGQTLPGANAPNEAAWINPNNITLNNPATPAVVTLQGVSQVTLIYGAVGPTSGSSPWSGSVTAPANAVHPAAFFNTNPSGGISWQGVGWTAGLFGFGGFDEWISLSPGGTAAASYNGAGAQPTFNGVVVVVQSDGKQITQFQTYGGSSGATSTVTFGPSGQFSAYGTVYWLAISGGGLTFGGSATPYDPTQSTVTDNQGNTWFFVVNSQAQTSNTGMTFTAIWACTTVIPGVKPTITATLHTTAGNLLNVGNMSCNLCECYHWIATGVFGGADVVLTQNQNGVNGFTTATLTPNFPNAMLVLVAAMSTQNSFPMTQPTGMGNWPGKVNVSWGNIFCKSITGPTSVTTSWGGSASNYAAILLDLPLASPIGEFPWQVGDISSGTWPPGGLTITFGATTPGNMIFIIVLVQNISSGAPANCSFTDTQGNAYKVYTSGGQSNGTPFCAVAIATNIKGGATNNVITLAAIGTGTNSNVEAYEFYMGPVPPNTANFSQVLQGSGYGSIPSTDAVMGLQVIVAGKQTSSASSSLVNVSLNVPGSQTFPVPLTSVQGSFTLATPISNWGLVLTPALVNQLAVNLVAQSNVNDTISISGLQVKFFLSPNPPSNFNWIKTYEQVDAEVDTLLLDASGFLWDEDVDQNPGTLNTIFNSILPNTFAKSVTFSDIEFIALSNLVNGTDVPRQWNGTNLDRVTMVGPGAACSASVAGGSGGSNTTAINTITQAAPVAIRRIAWGASINAQSDSTPGNVLVISLPGGSTHGGNPPLAMNIGDTIQLQNVTNPFPLKGGGSLPYNLNTAGPLTGGYYTLLSSGQPIIGGGETDTAFTLQAPAVQYGYSNDFGVPPSSGWTYQDTVATITLQAPLPNVGIGNTIQVTGTGGGPPSGYDGTWTVLGSPNAVSMTINSVILVGTTATYSFTLIPPSLPPTVNELVTTANVLNGSGIGSPNIFNVTNVKIQSVSGGTFSINIANPGSDIPSQPQTTATAQVAGTIFTFDPGQVIGNKSGGTVVGQGLVAVGQRKVCYAFLTRTGEITQPSPLYTFNITAGSGSIQVTGLSTGPPNVVARIVFFTGANGGNFFYIPQTVNVTIPGQPVQVNTSTIVNDNTSTQAQFSFSDAVLLAATAIDIPGNNLFNCIELGSCRGFLTYASRLFAWSEQQKVTNLRNLSFDGGITVGSPAPLGWTQDPTNGAGGSLSLGSPVFGWCFFINNASGLTQTTYGMITQPAVLDEFGVPIIQANQLYSVRICALCQPQPQSQGNLVVDLFSPGTGGGTSLGIFSIPLSSMTTTMQIYTGTLLTTPLTTGILNLKDLLIRIYATNIANGAQILIDRVEPFLTLQPVNTTALKGSYVNAQEQFDLVTGVCGPAQNMQPINGAMVLFDLLYALKERSWYSTFDNGVTEPFKWNWKEVSNKIGTIGIHSYDHGEGWALTANRQGVFFFEGGEPIKVSQEIQPLWDSINWTYGYTIWCRNDPEQRRFTVGIPIPTPNQWMPEFPTNANPTSPNVILMCNYRELNTGSAIAQTGPIRSTYMGRLMSPEPARKWSFWNILCPYSDYIDRANNQWPQFFCTGYGDSKVFQLLASTLNDDGNAINSFWVSYGFVKPEMQDAKGLGLFRMEFPYFTVLAIGSGTLNSYVYPESPFNRPYVLDPTPLPAITQGDLEIGVNCKGQRFFVRVGTNAVGAAFRCSKMVVPLIPDTWSPVRGWNAVTA